MTDRNTYRCQSCPDDADRQTDFEKWNRMTEHAVDVHDGRAQFTLMSVAGGSR